MTLAGPPLRPRRYSRPYGSELDAPVPLEIAVQFCACITDLDGGSNRAMRIVFVELRDAEDRDNRITDELLGCPAVTVNDHFCAVEVATHEPAK